MSNTSLPGAATNYGFSMFMDMVFRTVGAIGTLIAAGNSINVNPNTGGISGRYFNSGGPITINTTIANAIEVTYQMDRTSASNIVITKEVLIEAWY